MTLRILIVLNVIGCLVLSSIVFVYWGRERDLRLALDVEHERFMRCSKEVEAGHLERKSLLLDIASLKQSLEETSRNAHALKDELVQGEARLAEAQAQVNALTAQLKQWEGALADRDQRILERENELVLTRQRLDEAIAKLKSLQNR